MAKWYLSIAYVEDRYMLYKICRYVIERVLSLDAT